MQAKFALALLLPLALGIQQEQTFECLSGHDPNLSGTIGHFLASGALCAMGQGYRAKGVLNCAERQLHPDMLPVVAPLLSAIRAWENHYGAELEATYRDFGWSGPEVDKSAWVVLSETWLYTQQLCFYTSGPERADHLQPREAGLLSLLFADDNGARIPLLKAGARWNYTGETVCSAESPHEKERQARVIASMNLGEGSLFTGWHREKVERFHQEMYSTDPFLQAFISGWLPMFRRYKCIGKLGCDSDAGEGRVSIPRSSSSYTSTVIRGLMSGKPTCLIYTPVELSADSFYVSATGEYA